MNFLFHMHQPLYFKEGKIYLPFAFLHAIKDYFDIPYLVKKSGIKFTFNITSTLIESLKIYENDFKKDYFLSILLKDIKDLESKEIKYLKKLFFSVNFNYFIKPYKRFKELYKKNNLSYQEILDLEVLYLLSWCGKYLKSKDFIKDLIKKEQNFTKKDKENLIFFLLDFIKNILPLYKELLKKREISISTTPYSHPILPLLIDFSVAECSIPKNYFSLKEDANDQIELAKRVYKDIFDEEPRGFWPAEGAICKNSLSLFKEYGIKWIATDEIILKKSCKDCDKNFYEYNGVKIFFRNHMLSDLIGFYYRYLNVDDAVNDLLSRAKDDDLIIMDGENAWEYYKNGGYDFLEKLFFSLKDTKTFDELSTKNAPKLDNLEPGSWIDGDFKTWTCNRYKNRAWEEFFKIRRLIKPNKDIYNIEGSDWYWWYGDTNYSDFKKEFDEIFRDNLKKIYIKNSLPYPSYLDFPLEKVEKKSLFTFPKWLITPKVDGNVTFFEWVGAGRVDFKKGEFDFNPIVKWIKYGEDEENFYILTHLDVEIEIINSKYEIKKDSYIEIKTEKKDEIGVRFKKGNLSFVLYLYTDKEEYIKNWYI